MRFASTLEVDGAEGLVRMLRGSEFTGGKEGGGDRSHLRETVVNETGPRVHHRAPSRYPPVASSDDVSAGPVTSSAVSVRGVNGMKALPSPHPGVPADVGL